MDKFRGKSVHRNIPNIIALIFPRIDKSKMGLFTFPIQVSCSMTYCKSQGTSIDNVILDLGKREYKNMTYVALTRPTITGKMFISGDFTLERFKKAYIKNQK